MGSVFLLLAAPALLGALWAWRILSRRRRLRPLRQIAGQGALLDVAPVKGFHYAEGNETILPLLRQGEALTLRREPENIHDCNAVRLLRQDGQAIGYLPMAYNGIPAALLDRGIPLTARLGLGQPGSRRWLEVWLYWPGQPVSLPPPLPVWQQEQADRPGAQGIRLLAEERIQRLCKPRSRLFGGLFLDLVLLEPEREGEPDQPVLPLLGGRGEQIGWLPLSLLPSHRRRMASCMLARGEQLFACLDQQVSLPSAGLQCAALYWREKGFIGETGGIPAPAGAPPTGTL